MKEIFILTAFLLLIETNYAFSQPPQRDLNQIRSETSERNRAIENYDRRNPNGMNASTFRDARLIQNGKIPGSAVRSYVLAAQAETEVKVVSVGSGDTLLVDDGTNRSIIHILGIDAPENGQPFFEEAKKNLSDLLTDKKITLIYSLHNLKNELGYFPARVFISGRDVGLNLLGNGFAWRDAKDKFFLEEKTDSENKQAETKARIAKLGIWQNEKPEKPWEFKKKLEKSKGAKEKADKN